MTEILLILIFVLLILILGKLKTIWQTFLLLNFSIYDYEDILALKKQVSDGRKFLGKLRKKGKLDTLNNDPKDCTVTIDGEQIPYLGYLGTIESPNKMAEIFLEANMKAKSGVSKKECLDYVDKRFEEEKIHI